MPNLLKNLFTTAIIFLLLITVSASAEFPIKDGDKVVFWGDSITDNAHYPRTIENYVRGKYPRMKVDFYNLGWGGDSVSTLKRMQRDLLPIDPTLVFINLGMNDGRYAPYNEATGQAYISGMKELVILIQTKTKARIILVTPITYETGVRMDNEGKKLDLFYPETLRKLSELLIKFGKEKNIPVVDLNKSYSETMAKYKSANPAIKFSGDSIHPSSTGQALMAYLILKGIEADGKILELSIDSKSGKILKNENQDISGYVNSKDSLSFKRKVNTFPFLTSGEPLSIEKKDWYDALNQNRITVKGLTAPYYILAINDNNRQFCVFTKDELSRGVNLSEYNLDLPEYSTASFIGSCVSEKHSARYTRWRWILCKGIKSPYDFANYNPETCESLLLADKANLLNNFLESEKIFCNEYTLKLIPTDKPELSEDAMISSSLKISDNPDNIITGTWAVPPTLSESSDGGAKVYSFKYSFTNWWAGFGLNLNNWGSSAPVDISSYSAMQVSYKGVSGGQSFTVSLTSTSGTNNVQSESVEIGTQSENYKTVELPMSKFRKDNLDLTKITQIMFSITGVQTGNGDVSIKTIKFVAKK